MSDAELLHQALGGIFLAIVGYVLVEQFIGGSNRR